MQKIVYLSNSRDYTEQGNINENKYFKQINELLENGWRVAQLNPNAVAINGGISSAQSETFVSFVVLEKDEENE